MNRLQTLIGSARQELRAKDKSSVARQAKPDNGKVVISSNGATNTRPSRPQQRTEALQVDKKKTSSNSDTKVRTSSSGRSRRTMEDLPKGYIQSVRGALAPKALGITMAHEHLYHRATQGMFKPREPAPDFKYMAESPYDAQNLWWINFHPYSHRDNLRFDDSETQEAITSDLNHFHQNKGSCIVECSTMGRDLQVLKSLSVETKVNIVAGAGFYVAPGQSKETIALKTEQMYETIKKDFFVGDSSGTKCGIIGEIGTCWPVDPFEKRTLRAAAEVQCQYPSIPVSIHPGRHKDAPAEVMRLFLEAGGNATKTVMCHLDRTILDDGDLLEFAKIGTILEFDLFGVETSYYELSDELDMPSDAVRINRLKKLIDESLGDRIVISHDIHTKQRLMHYGGHGYSHIIQNVVPKMKMRGFSKQNIEDILINTPRRWLTL